MEGVALIERERSTAAERAKAGERGLEGGQAGALCLHRRAHGGPRTPERTPRVATHTPSAQRALRAALRFGCLSPQPARRSSHVRVDAAQPSKCTLVPPPSASMAGSSPPHTVSADMAAMCAKGREVAAQGTHMQLMVVPRSLAKHSKRGFSTRGRTLSEKSTKMRIKM